MKNTKLLGFLLMLGVKTFAQSAISISLDSCYKWSKNNYPLLKQMALIEKTKEYSLDNASKGYLPQLNFVGQATYQSEVTKIPIALPGMHIQELNKDQYRVYGEISQSLSDPLIIKQQKELIKANTSAEKEKLEVELYKLKERVNQLYFGILLIDGQIDQTTLLKKDIELGLSKVKAAISNGVGYKTNADMLYAELLKIEQKNIELKASRKGFLDMLSLFINKPLSEDVHLDIPSIKASNQVINRPELKLYDVQKKSFDIQNKLLRSKNVPKISLFFQGGYGRPTLNALSNDFGTYYIGGARFNWNFSGLYTYKKEKQIFDISQNLIDIQKEVFMLNTNLLLKQQDSEVNKYSAFTNSDMQMIALREKIKNTASIQLENGIITPLEFLNAANAEDQAKQNLVIHKIQLLLAQYNSQTTLGN